MRAFVFIAGSAIAGLALLCAGCKPEAPKPAAEKAAKSDTKGAPKDTPKEAPAAKPVRETKEEPQVTEPVAVEAPTKPEPPKKPQKNKPSLAARIADLMIREGELRIQLDATTNDAERAALKRRIEETNKERLELYTLVGSEK